MKRILSIIICYSVIGSISFGQVSSDIDLKLTGEMQFICNYSLSENNLDLKLGYTDMGIKGLYKKKLGIRLIFAVFSNYNISLLDGFLFYKPKEFVELKAGQYKIPFSLEALTAPFKKDFIEDAYASRMVSSRDFGAGLSYTNTHFNISTSIVNGDGINKKDQNDRKDIVGRIVLFPFNYLDLGAAFYIGKSGIDSLLQKKNLYNLQFQLKKPFDIKLQSEFTYADYENFNDRAFYITLSKFLPEKLINNNNIETLIRYEFNKSDANDDTQKLTLGFNYFLERKNNFKIQLNYNFSWINDEYKNSATALDLHFNY